MLQPLNIAVNKPAKSFLQNCFGEWVHREGNEAAGQENMDELKSAKIEPTDLSMQVIKQISAMWPENIHCVKLLKAVKFLSRNPLLIVYGFLKSGITGALDDVMEDLTEGQF